MGGGSELVVVSVVGGHIEGQSALTSSGFYFTTNRLDTDPHLRKHRHPPRTDKVTDLKSLFRMIPAPYCTLGGGED